MCAHFSLYTTLDEDLPPLWIAPHPHWTWVGDAVYHWGEQTSRSWQKLCLHCREGQTCRECHWLADHGCAACMSINEERQNIHIGIYNVRLNFSPVKYSQTAHTLHACIVANTLLISPTVETYRKWWVDQNLHCTKAKELKINVLISEGSPPSEKCPNYYIVLNSLHQVVVTHWHKHFSFTCIRTLWSVSGENWW